MPRKKRSANRPVSPPPARRGSFQACSEDAFAAPTKKLEKDRQKSSNGRSRTDSSPDVETATCSNPRNDRADSARRQDQAKTPHVESTAKSGFHEVPLNRPTATASGSSISGKSMSTQFREKGNIMYQKALQDGIAPIIKRSRLDDALQLYTRAANLADGPAKQADWSSATKNCGMATKRMARCSTDEAAALELFKESLKYMSQALLRGSDVHGGAWEEKLRKEMELSYYAVLEIIDSLSDVKERLRELYQVVGTLPAGLVQARAKHNIADILFKESIRLLEGGDYRECLKCLHDLHQPVEEALSLLRGWNLDQEAQDLESDLRVLKQDALYHISTAESVQARTCGEKILESLYQEENLNMTALWEAVDWFKEASLKAAELDLEQEAAALSFLGLINEKVLFSVTKAKGYYKRCLELVDAAQPKTFLTEKWYQQCVQGYQVIQNRERSRDEAAQQKIRRKFLDALKDELAALEKANTSASSLLEHLYKHHSPPKTPKFSQKHLEELKKNEECPEKMDLDVRKARKKLLLKACQDFHPDKIQEKAGECEEDKAKRKVLMEEVTKMITKYYEHLKLG
ncbi:uncharacterized protein LOC110989308 [Acanthaster planci]|uniref:Uncharacterized protein LOC110989308 n=1 Tax=Acanthaster planci TaxID=133434 RepID=A0A8B7ZX04_ACAPL|nr:uncharacterized protein LOC110989308 [Acanthaster planci]XP_022109295.1 uncharacterized protein LOC110989308 [Acanthaster planci]